MKTKDRETERRERFAVMLRELIYQLQDGRRPNDNFNHVYVSFFTKRGRCIVDDIGVADALDYLANDIFHFAEFDLDEAFSVKAHCQ